jgi:subtilase family serine protease
MAPVHGRTIIPKSSTYTAADLGVRMHTHIRVFVPDGPRLTPNELPPYSGYAFETPASLACVYGLVPRTPGCNPNVTTNNPSGGSGTIAIIDAYDDPNATSDLATYSAQFGLATPNFSVVYASGTKPLEDPTGGWELEESVDIEMAHAMAPGAKLYLVEAASNSFNDLFSAVTVGANLVSCGQITCPHGGHGHGEVSMSWGGSEFSTETEGDSFFVQHGVVFFASAGDSAGTEYPCTSPNAVCVGGTDTARSIFTGNFLYEVAWMDGGGGMSAYEPRPNYQNSLREVVGPSRGVPDVSFDGGENTPVWIYDGFGVDGEPGGWYTVYGTSVGAPSMAAIVNAAGSFHDSSTDELRQIYSFPGFPGAGFNDIARGYCGPYDTFAATQGWDFCTGVGSPNGYAGK